MIQILKIIACHLIGDYVLQTQYIATEKGKDWYLLFVHCFLYCVPFAMVFGSDVRLIIIFVTHLVVDMLKARYNKINLAVDQIIHYAVGLLTYLLLTYL